MGANTAIKILKIVAKYQVVLLPSCEAVLTLLQNISILRWWFAEKFNFDSTRCKSVRLPKRHSNLFSRSNLAIGHRLTHYLQQSGDLAIDFWNYCDICLTGEWVQIFKIPVFCSTVCCGMLLFWLGRVSKYQDSANLSHSSVKQISQQFRKSTARTPDCCVMCAGGTWSRDYCEKIG